MIYQLTDGQYFAVGIIGSLYLAAVLYGLVDFVRRVGK